MGPAAQMAQFELRKISNRVRFILAVIAGQVAVSNRRKAAVEAELEAQGFDRMPNTRKARGLVAARCSPLQHCTARCSMHTSG